MQIDDVNKSDGQDAIEGEMLWCSTGAGALDFASWLSDDILLVVGWFQVESGQSIKVSLTRNGRPVSVEARCLSYPRPDMPEAGPSVGKVLTIRCSNVETPGGEIGTLSVHVDGRASALVQGELTEILTDLQTLVRESLAGLPPEPRTAIMGFLSATPVELQSTASPTQLSKSLFSLRECLRERLPVCIIAADLPLGLHVDTIMAIDAQAYYMRGWVRDEETAITDLTVVSPEGCRVRILDHIFRYPRPDVEQFYGNAASARITPNSGFISYFETSAPSHLTAGWSLEMQTASGIAVEVSAPGVIDEPIAVRNAILADLTYERPPNEQLRRTHTFPALRRLQDRLRHQSAVERVDQYGTPPSSPHVTIIVPLYQRIDFLEHQMVQFVHDPEIYQTDLIYVLDSPEQAESLEHLAIQIFPLYGIPFRVVTLKRNVGFAGANNIAATFARGRLLLLLNSDVFPNRPGWLSTMVEFHDATPGIGALGPKLLYEDESLQHAGMYAARPIGSHLWENRHYFKGLHRQLPAANVPRAVPAVTAACLLIDTELYQRLGGLRGLYVQGDYEDSDLCLRLIEAGYTNWYLPDAELYHLEGQSYPSELRQLTYQYNCWLHTHLWNEHLETVMARYASPATAAPALAEHR